MERIEPVRGISGSLAAAVMGVNPWKSPLSAYLEIYGLAEEEEREAMLWGSRLEPLLAREYQERTGAILWPHTDFGLGHRYPLKHKEISWWEGTPDRLVIEDPRFLINTNTEKAQAAMEEVLADPAFWRQVVKGWEGKTAGWRMMHLWGEEDTDEIPEIYLIQCSWYLELTRSYNPNISNWDVSVLIGGQKFRTYKVDYNSDLVESMKAKAGEFWHEHVLARTPPPPSADPAWKKYFRIFLAESSSPLEKASEREAELFYEAWRAYKNLKAMEQEYEALCNALKLAIGKREGIEGDGWRITWKKSKDRVETDWEKAYFALCEYCADKGLLINDEDFSGKYTIIKPGPRIFRPVWPRENANGSS